MGGSVCSVCPVGPAEKITSDTTSTAHSAFWKPKLSVMLAPMASRARKEMPPMAVLATTPGAQRRYELAA